MSSTLGETLVEQSRRLRVVLLILLARCYAIAKPAWLIGLDLVEWMQYQLSAEAKEYAFFGTSAEAIPLTHVLHPGLAMGFYDVRTRMWRNAAAFAAANHRFDWLAVEFRTPTGHVIDATPWITSLRFPQHAAPPTMQHLFTMYRLQHNRYLEPGTRALIVDAVGDEHDCAGDTIPPAAEQL